MFDYPAAKYRPQEITYGRNSVTDGYEWMRDASSPETVAFTEEENAFTDRYFAQHKDCFEKYYKEQREMADALMFHGVIRTPAGICASGEFADGISSTVLLDEDFTTKMIITDSDFMKGVHVHDIYPNPTRKDIYLLLVLRDKAERTSGFVYDAGQKKVLAELTDTFSVDWSADGCCAYYCRASHREDGTVANTLCRYDIDTGEDTDLYTYGGHAAYGIVFPMDEGGVIVKFAVDYHAGETVILEGEGGESIIPYDGNDRQYIGTAGDRHFFITDEEAPLGKIVAVKKGEDFRNAATVIVEAEEKITRAGICGEKIICVYESAGSQSLCIYDEDGKRHEVGLPCQYGKIDIAPREFRAVNPLFTYESFAVPSCVMELDTEQYVADVVYKSEEFCDDVVAERIFYTSQDGVRLPAYLVRRKDVTRNGSNRALFYGYGGYNASNYVASSACGMSIVKWLEEGGVYVHCIIRGGGEYGEEWHRGGWKDNKKNVFRDFCDIVEGVIADKWTNPSKTAICGLSNGGLLMTALITGRPELFGCVIASVPQTDLLGFVYDDRGSMYITEYGDPREDRMFAYMKSYSPYHNIREGVSYPGIYIQAGAMDNNVPAYHAKKFTAKMQALKGERPVLLRILPYGSHDRGTGEYFRRTIAEMRAFIDIELGRGGDSIG